MHQAGSDEEARDARADAPVVFDAILAVISVVFEVLVSLYEVGQLVVLTNKKRKRKRRV